MVHRTNFETPLTPTALLPRRREHLAQRGPGPERTVADGQLGVLFQAAPLEVEQHLAPALGAHPHAVGHGQQLLVAIFIDAHDHQFIGANDHQNALFVGKSIPRIDF